MCGILGTVGFSLDSEMLSHLRHRGPDGHGVELVRCRDRAIWLGHTRLSILDLSVAGHQPMRSRDGRWWVTFNGEIYNHLDLRKELKGPFRGHSDTETLVELVADKGIEKTLPLLNGMFAFAALDTQTGKLYLARDPFGVKPLYYNLASNGLVFSSEIRAINVVLKHAKLPAESIDEIALQKFLMFRYTPSPDTLWQNVKRLPPGTIMTFDIGTGAVVSSHYTRPSADRFDGSVQDAVDLYQEKLGSAVRRQLLSDVPVGVLLSGGIDSALVAAMAKDTGVEVPCFTVGFGGGHSECEIEDAEHTARTLGLSLSKVEITPEELKSSLPSIVRAIEEPLGTTSVLPMWKLVMRAREEVKVVLTGQGTDEPWGGYYRYQVELLRKVLPFPLLWQVGQTLAKFWHSKPESMERGLRSLSQKEPLGQIIEASCLFDSVERRMLTGSNDDLGISKSLSGWLDWLAPVDNLSGAERMMRIDSRMNLADDLLLYGDKISMATSLEARVPMLDVELVRFVESLPIEYRVQWRNGKVVHKAMAERYLPSEIVHRPKKGFQVPFGSWSRNEWRGWLEPLLLDGLDGLLSRNAVEKLWRQHLAGKPDRSRQIFALMMLSLWRHEHSWNSG